ncbi:hypothetical protein H8B02_23010 [Bradyrhizobium sp. Pear77]|nr:hypothetical protein [Bradyrhizobium altum]MCC8956193.1 hypothetical protein [Bradyrhizobium altum]
MAEASAKNFLVALGYPSIPLSMIAADPHGLAKAIAALNWMAQQIDQFSG